MDLELRGKKAFITGGSVGIGLAGAHALAAEGVDVAICARDQERVKRDRPVVVQLAQRDAQPVCVTEPIGGVVA